MIASALIFTGTIAAAVFHLRMVETGPALRDFTGAMFGCGLIVLGASILVGGA